jgi:hypothetical protein
MANYRTMKDIPVSFKSDGSYSFVWKEDFTSVLLMIPST